MEILCFACVLVLIYIYGLLLCFDNVTMATCYLSLARPIKLDANTCSFGGNEKLVRKSLRLQVEDGHAVLLGPTVEAR